MGMLAEYLRTEGQRIRADMQKRDAEVKEWTDALESLFTNIGKWLDSCDPDRLLVRALRAVKLTDSFLGEYQAKELRISLRDRSLRILPRARYVAATIRPVGQEVSVRAHGLVEIRESVGESCHLFQHPSGEWYISDGVANLNTLDNLVVPLDADRFEAAVWTMLR